MTDSPKILSTDFEDANRKTVNSQPIEGGTCTPVSSSLPPGVPEDLWPTFLQCVSCDRPITALSSFPTCPHCHSSVLKGHYDLSGLDRHQWIQTLRQRPSSLWRYQELLPALEPQHRVTLGEGYTPLVPALRLGAAWGANHVYLKDERQNPTGSFKDRQATVALSILKARGVQRLVLASTGNVGIAYAAYGSRAGIATTIFFPQDVPPEKVRETQVYGSTVVQLPKNYDETKVAAAQFAQAEGWFLDQGVKGFAGVESMKTMAFEIAEQLGWRSPDWYIQGVSGGLGPIGVAKGFEELLALGLVDKVPALGLIQTAGCDPLVQAWKAGAAEVTAIDHPKTTILPLATGNPGVAYPILKALLDRHGGAMTTVTDEVAFDTLRRVAGQEGISVEPATAVAIAGTLDLIHQGIIAPHETVIINCSGHTYPVSQAILDRRQLEAN